MIKKDMEENKDISLITAALDMLDSVESVITTEDVVREDETTYQPKVESEQKISSQPTFRGEDRKKIKQWLLAQLV